MKRGKHQNYGTFPADVVGQYSVNTVHSNKQEQSPLTGFITTSVLAIPSYTLHLVVLGGKQRSGVVSTPPAASQAQNQARPLLLRVTISTSTLFSCDICVPVLLLCLSPILLLSVSVFLLRVNSPILPFSPGPLASLEIRSARLSQAISVTPSPSNSPAI